MESNKVYIKYTNCITPLGFDVSTNIAAISSGTSGIALQDNKMLLDAPFYAGVINSDKIDTAFAAISDKEEFTRLEKIMVLALKPVLDASGVAPGHKTGLIVSTTKGNITALDGNDVPPQNAYLHKMAGNIAQYFGFTTMPIVISNACVSGILSVAVAKRLVQSGMYNNVFIVSGDEVSEFVVSGFNALLAMSDVPCKPFSGSRNGITLGEAAAAVLVSADDAGAKAVIAGEASVNDANHISGPHRNGEGLLRSINNALNEAGITAQDIDYISAHGTATLYNDDMETIAFERAGLQHVPLNSFKGYYGHTLGSSGLLESVIGLECMAQNTLFASMGFDHEDVSGVNVIRENTGKNIDYFLKTASGFGGCNTAVVFKKVK